MAVAGGIRFRLYAPDMSAVDLILRDAPRPMHRIADGFFELVAADARPGDAYAFGLAGRQVPDPAGRGLETDVEGRSLIVDPAIFGRNRRIGRPIEEAVILEVHVGTASPEGTFRGLAALLDRFVDTGFTALQLMPIAAFPGRWGWGYDGVLPFAPAPAYGTPDDLVTLVAAAHEHGLMIFQDVVYNHFGPQGNSLPLYASEMFDAGSRTPWGAAIDFRRPEVRRFFVENARMWVEDYGFDGLRFDAIHAYHPQGLMPFARELAEEMAGLDPRPILIAENEHNLADLLERGAAGRPLAFDAQWDDDLHNALHVALTGETEGYYAAYASDPVALLARSLAVGFAYQGESEPLHVGRRRGQPSGHLPPTAFVAFAQNHDQIGNRPVGDRLAEMLRPEQTEVARFLVLMAPHVPMMFMGEDFAARTRFPFFCDFSGDLAKAVRDGRRREFAAFAGFAGEIPDPLAEETFRAAKLDWAASESPEGLAVRAATRQLLTLRRSQIQPLLQSRSLGSDRRVTGRAFIVGWRFEAGRLVIAANLAGTAATVGLSPDEAALADDPLAEVGAVHAGGGSLFLAPWSAAAWVTP